MLTKLYDRRRIVLVCLMNMSILCFLACVGSVETEAPPARHAQSIIPTDALIYQGRIHDLSIEQQGETLHVDAISRLRFFLAENEQEVLQGAAVEMAVPTLSFLADASEEAPGQYAVELQESMTITPTVAGLSLSQIDTWQIQPLGYTLALGSDAQSHTFQFDPVQLADFVAALDGTAALIAGMPQALGHIAEAGIQAAAESPQAYDIPLEFSFNARLLDDSGTPLANTAVSAVVELPSHALSETIEATTDEDGVFVLARTEQVQLSVSGGALTVLSEPLEVEGASFVAIQSWWPGGCRYNSDCNDGNACTTDVCGSDNRCINEYTTPCQGQDGCCNPTCTNDPDCNGNDTNNGAPDGDNPSGVADDPINVTTGNMWTTVQDFEIPGRGLSIEFSRTYNSTSSYDGALGVGWTHSYNVNLNDLGDTVEEMDEDGTLVIFSQNSDGTYTSPVGNYDHLTKQEDGSFVLVRKHGITLQFDEQGRLQSIADRNNNHVTLEYSQGNLATITDTVGRTITFAHDSSGRITSIIEPQGQTLSYGYDADTGDLTSFTNAMGHTTTYAYDNHLLVNVSFPEREVPGQDPQPSNIFLTYDSEGRANSFSYDGNNQRVDLEYDAENQFTRVFNSRGFETVYYWEEIGNTRVITRIVDAMGGERLLEWDDALNLVQETDANGQSTDMAYDDHGNLISRTDPTGAVTTFSYEPNFDLCTAVTGPLGHTTALAYDGQGNIVSVTDADGRQTSFARALNGDLQQVTTADGTHMTYAHDAHGNLSAVAGSAMQPISFVHDMHGNATGATSARGVTTTTSFDAMNRPMGIQAANGSTIGLAYDEMGNLTGITDARGQEMRYAYDGAGRLVATQNALGHTTHFTYDTEGNLIRITDANGNQTTYNYDSLNRLSSKISPLGYMTHFAYDAVGNLVSKIDANGNMTTFTHDAMKRLVHVAHDDGTEVAFTYDVAGRRTSMTDTRGTTHYVHDSVGRLLQVDGPGPQDTISYSYDARGNRVAMIDPDGGETLYEYDGMNNLLRVIDPMGYVTSYTYDEDSNLVDVSYPNGTRTTYTMDDVNRVAQLINHGPNDDVISSFAYEYDEAGMRKRVTMVDGESIEYTYDAINQLISEVRRKTEPSQRVLFANHFEFDAVGNRVAVERFIQGAILPQGATDPWNPRGRSRMAYTYDQENRLQTVEVRRGHQGDDEANDDDDNGTPGGSSDDNAEDTILVRFNLAVTADQIADVNAGFGVVEDGEIPRLGVHVLKIPVGTEADAMAQAYAQLQEVEFAETNHMARITATPNDPMFGEQWALENAGQNGGLADADIDAESAWDVVTGSSGLVIAIVDTGCDLDHPDLQSRIISGQDFVNGDNDPDDDHGHGTFVAGIAAASGNDGIGVAGMVWDGFILPVKVLDASGQGTYDQVASGIVYAVDNGADVINLSLGGDVPGQTLQDAMQYAHDAGVTVVCAAGNGNGPVMFPAAYTQFCIAVSATDHNDERAPFSSFGPEVDVAAPGVDILSTWKDGGYSTSNGTSAAAPFVTGLAGLLISQNATLQPPEVEARIQATAEDVNASSHPGFDVFVGAGRINAGQAVSLPPDTSGPIHAVMTFTYDATGNQIAMEVDAPGRRIDRSTGFTYDSRNRLTRITMDDGSLQEFEYDPQGRRTRTITNDTVRDYVYDGLNVLLERTTEGETYARYTRGRGLGGGIGSIISARVHGQMHEDEDPQWHTLFPNYDVMGTVTSLSDLTGAPMQHFTYDAYGNLLATAGSLGVFEHRHSTKRFSADSGLLYFGARYYDPRVGRFITPDPLTWAPDDPRRFDRLENLTEALTRMSRDSMISSSPLPAGVDLTSIALLVNQGIMDPTVMSVDDLLHEAYGSVILRAGKLRPQNLHRQQYCFNNPVNLIDPWGFSAVGSVDVWAEFLFILQVIGLMIAIFTVASPLGVLGIIIAVVLLAARVFDLFFASLGLLIVGCRVSRDSERKSWLGDSFRRWLGKSRT